MKFTYTKQVELTTEDAMAKANEYLKNKGYEYVFFDVVKSEKTETTIYLVVVYMDKTYKVSATLNKDYFEKCLTGFLSDIYSEYDAENYVEGK